MSSNIPEIERKVFAHGNPFVLSKKCPNFNPYILTKLCWKPLIYGLKSYRAQKIKIEASISIFNLYFLHSSTS